MDEPKRIWLQLNDDPPTWCQHRVSPDDIEYVRVDDIRYMLRIYAEARSRMSRLVSHRAEGWFGIGIGDDYNARLWRKYHALADCIYKKMMECE